MLIIEHLSLLRQHIHEIHQKNKNVALVPTMGNIHGGHIELVNKARECADIVVVSIFVNPMQFDRTDDLQLYSRTLQEDYKKLNEHQVDFVFVPLSEEIYPRGIKLTTYIDIPGISTILEGANRPGHFRGVATIVSKLFNIIQPNTAYFGEKDYQQLILIRKMVTDMNYDIDIVSVPTVRAKDGLAFSSRNNHLTLEQRKIAPGIIKVINNIEKAFYVKILSIDKIKDIAEQELSNKGFRVDYVQIRDANTLLELTNNSKNAVILVAAWLGHVRLIDSKVINL